MKETLTKTLNNEMLLVRMTPELKSRLLEYAEGVGKSAAHVVRDFIDFYAQPRLLKNKRKAR